jgi:hypothetical protein
VRIRSSEQLKTLKLQIQTSTCSGSKKKVGNRRHWRRSFPPRGTSNRTNPKSNRRHRKNPSRIALRKNPNRLTCLTCTRGCLGLCSASDEAESGEASARASAAPATIGIPERVSAGSRWCELDRNRVCRRTFVRGQ